MNTQLQKVRQEALMLCAPVFHKMEEISLFNMQKVLEAFRKNHLSAYHFAPSNGYGYGDPGRGAWGDRSQKGGGRGRASARSRRT